MSRRRREIPIFRTAETLRPSDAIEYDVSPHGTATTDTVLLPPLRVLRQTYLTSTTTLIRRVQATPLEGEHVR